MTVNKAGSARLKKMEAIHERAALLLMQRGSVADVAQEIDVHPDTISNWKRSPVFARFYRKLRREAYDEALAVLQAASLAAAAKFANALSWDDPDNVKIDIQEGPDGKSIVHAGRPDLALQAAGQIFAHSSKWLDGVDVVERVERLERKMRKKKTKE